MSQRDKYFDMMGAGMDLITPAIKKHPAAAIGGYNYEPRPEGYRRFQGYEKVDGQGNPSASKYYILNFDASTVAIVAGDTVTGLASGATAKALVDGVLESGTYGGGDAVGYLVLWNLVGAYLDNEALQVSAATRALANGTELLEGAGTDANNMLWRVAAVDARRATIQEVAGSGPIRGVWCYNGNIYAFRDNAGATACDMWESNGPSGWIAVDLQQHLHFDAGILVINVGDTVNGLTSSATAVVERVVVISGDWSTNDATGFLILSSVVGVFQDNEDLRVATSKKADVDGVLVDGLLGAGGYFNFLSHNFYGGSGTRRMYGANGAGQAFVFDGDFANIETGMVIDEPEYIGVKKDTLFLSFAGGSLQFAGAGNPLAWSVVLGAGEIGMGDEITGICREYANGAAVLCRNKTAILYGTDFSASGDAALDVVSDEAGAIAGSVQTLVKPTFFDNTGIRDLTAVQAYGNFQFGDGDGLSGAIKPLINSKKSAGVSVTCSVVVKEQMQYWLFFDDKSIFLLSMATGKPRLMPMYMPLIVRCAYSCEDANGDEVVYFGSDDGYVYSLGTGNNFDGDEIEYLLRLPFWHLGSPNHNKRFHKAILELDPSTSGTTTLNINADFSYGNPDQPSIDAQTFTVTGGGGFWNTALWNQFYWGATVEGQAEAYIEGEGLNISIGLGGTIAAEEPHTITGNTYYYSPRRLKR